MPLPPRIYLNPHHTGSPAIVEVPTKIRAPGQRREVRANERKFCEMSPAERQRLHDSFERLW
ncbi:MAG: hypothetical protein EPN69_08585 [Rhodanobacter sp.]|nr:MAG: hypothetical protein EPN69_08585 [Rhodanobacter sp.]TAM02791.1 MAG: hypothetical protein EPN71_04355 [Rhodanobacter sp.]TAM42706.1 MAG: hypothetical protein EPN58_01890 [Rhodanobacter sp.]TAN26864.1 MAG: hypothetical protein EPN32_05615 [Rhodanobacter sp.]